ncbi:DNA recombination protein RmuC [Clostridium sp. 'deep sea']|nr:DNA recombination protein RmuC [Clostridium sp. 'deep sea']
MDLNIGTIREQIYKDSGLQNEIISNKIGAFQTILTERFAALEKELIERFSKLEMKLSNELGVNRTNQINSLNEFKDNLGNELNINFNRLNSTVESKLNAINNKVEERLMEGFKQTNKTFSSILERLSKIDEAQRKIESLSSNIVSLQDILTDKKSRGTFGEVQLNQILKSVFGDKSDSVFELQKKLPNSYIVDAVIKTPEPLGMVAIDSKFPLENYRKMINKDLTEDEQKRARREFKYNVKKHIDDISRKYIISEVTSNQAIMFIPAEAIFAEINAYHEDLVDYSRKHRIWLASPTTLMSVLTTVQVMLQNIERERLASVIHDELNKLGDEFLRYRRRWEKLKDRIERVSNDVKNVHITTEKISNKFDKISKAELMVEAESDVEILLEVPVDQN